MNYAIPPMSVSHTACWHAPGAVFTSFKASYGLNGLPLLVLALCLRKWTSRIRGTQISDCQVAMVGSCRPQVALVYSRFWNSGACILDSMSGSSFPTAACTQLKANIKQHVKLAAYAVPGLWWLSSALCAENPCPSSKDWCVHLDLGGHCLWRCQGGDGWMHGGAYNSLPKLNSTTPTFTGN